MSGLLNEAVTPCPSRSSNGNDTIDSVLRADPDPFDETANLEFTTEIRAPALTKAKPKRRNRIPSSFQIHDDENEEKPAPSVNKWRRENGASVPMEASSRKSSSLLSQPAQRFRPKVGFAPSPSTNMHRPGESELKPRREKPRPSTATNNDLLMQVTGKERIMEKDTLKTDVRRETVYIPTDDTTVASVFMDMFSPLKSQALRNVDSQTPKDAEMDILETRIMKKRNAKRSLAGSARRAPLQTNTKIAQEASIRVDVAGKNGGKENTPPGLRLVGSVGVDKGCRRELPPLEQPKTELAGSAAKPGSVRSNVQMSSTSNKLRAARPVNKSPQRTVLGDKSNARPTTASTVQKRDIIKPKQEHGEEHISPRTQKPALSKLMNHPTPNVVSSKVVSTTKAKKLNQKSPLLTEDIPKPALYEDNWLTHQEILITQLLNGLFEQTDGQTGCDDPATLRHELLDYYQDDSFTLLYKRLQASLLYGALSIPKDVLTRDARLKQDLGLKRKFLDIWTQTYDPHALRAAVETVIGRKLFQDDDEGQGRSCTTASKEKLLNKRLEGFLETFLLRNEDMPQTEPQAQRARASARAYRRTVLRSIMIVALLDKARMFAGMTTTLPRRLFLTSSSMKSSATVLRALARLLLPSSGDIIKSLGQLDCQVAYEQHRLEEYDYRISNLAVDVRDGIRLTRVVELLLYSQDPEHTATVTVPDAGTLLTPHLKLPSASRAVKLFNVQIALNALASGANGVMHDVAAEDIVDGHREKTLALLWRLVSKWGLPGLVDWDDVRQEITRLQRRAVAQFGHEHVANADWVVGITELGQQHNEYTALLQQWASLLAWLKGLRLNNFSTSFADNRTYDSIVEEYQDYILGSVECRGSLTSRLQALGCSSQFGMSSVPLAVLFF